MSQRLMDAHLDSIACPHCGEMNSISGVKMPRSFNDDPFNFQCYNQETEKGCFKYITLVAQVVFRVLSPDYKEKLKADPGALE